MEEELQQRIRTFNTFIQDGLAKLPRRLSSVNNNAQIFIGVEFFEADINILIAMCIGFWADITVMSALIMASMTGTSATVATTIFSAVRGDLAQNNVLKSVSQQILGSTSREHLMLSALLDIASKLKEHRNTFAHWTWGFSRDLPGDALFISSAAMMDHDLRPVPIGSPRNGFALLGEIDRSKIYTYSKNDLEVVKIALSELSECFALFRLMVVPQLRAEIGMGDIYWKNLMQKPGVEPGFNKLAAKLKGAIKS